MKKNWLIVSLIYSFISLSVVSFMLYELDYFFFKSEFSWVYKTQVAEAKQNIGILNRAQHAYYLDNNKFSDSIKKLDVGIKTETLNYRYRILSLKKIQFQILNGIVLPCPHDCVMMIAQSKKNTLRSYVTVISTIERTDMVIDKLTIGVVCESEKPTTLPPVPIFHKYEFRGVQYLGCPKGYKDLNELRG